MQISRDPAPEDDSRLAWFIEQPDRDVQVEVDALDALHPGTLEEALMDAIASEWDDDAYADALDREWREGWKLVCATEFMDTNSEAA